MHEELRSQLHAQVKAADKPREGRSLKELLKTNEILKGYESQRLRTFCTSECMEPSRDLDGFGKSLFSGNLQMVRVEYLGRIAAGSDIFGSTEKAEIAVSKHLQEYSWGPTAVPLYNLLGLFMIIRPALRSQYLEIAQFYIETAEVPVDGTDLSGTTALSHSISTKPGVDFEYAQMLYDAGGDINHRNRYGGTVGHEIIQVYLFQDQKAVNDAKDAFEWYLTHGGNIDIADSDGCTTRFTMERLRRAVPGFQIIAEKEHRRRRALGDACCTCCGRGDRKLLSCGRCKSARYCQPLGRACQKVDWPRHKKECKSQG